MNGLLDPSTPWPWLLYLLAGAGLVTAVIPSIVNSCDQLTRDVYRAQPAAKALLWIVFWAFWPLLAAGFAIVGLLYAAGWVLDWLSWIVDRARNGIVKAVRRKA